MKGCSLVVADFSESEQSSALFMVKMKDSL